MDLDGVDRDGVGSSNPSSDRGDVVEHETAVVVNAG